MDIDGRILSRILISDVVLEAWPWPGGQI